jgi:hypothetical protein
VIWSENQSVRDQIRKQQAVLAIENVINERMRRCRIGRITAKPY